MYKGNYSLFHNTTVMVKYM